MSWRIILLEHSAVGLKTNWKKHTLLVTGT